MRKFKCNVLKKSLVTLDSNGIHVETDESHPKYIEDWILNGPELVKKLIQEKTLKFYDQNSREVQIALQKNKEKH